eukprot:TRINITY_DN34593_c0_g1_i1.p3 TRINITY_DN34593_c0_g1~~TRINITY_DN34593_c0_g1_i1.p3  ORF type:complete len:120 (-),score=16.05 TRINITY_DN34593_c0_g1_i1:251-610(-)
MAVCPHGARGCSAGQTLAAVIEDLQREGQLNADDAGLVLGAFDTAFSEELSVLPVFWSLHLSAKLRSFQIILDEHDFLVEKACANASGAIFYDVPYLRIVSKRPRGSAPPLRKKIPRRA